MAGELRVAKNQLKSKCRGPVGQGPANTHGYGAANCQGDEAKARAEPSQAGERSGRVAWTERRKGRRKHRFEEQAPQPPSADRAEQEPGRLT